MMLDFKEIPLANTGIGDQDSFELFARDFLEEIGYEIVTDPTRGADNGKDFIVKETRLGVSSQKSEVKWLISCKHNAHSGKSVTPSIEQNINDRVKSNGCDGFIGFYSTIPSEGLIFNLKNIPHQIFDSKKIEKYIVGYQKHHDIFIRYFPNSYLKWKELLFAFEPIKLFDFYLEKNTGFDLFKRIFKTNENIYRALKNSSDILEFLNFRSIKIVPKDIETEIDLLYNKCEKEISHLGYSDKSNYVNQIFFNNILNEQKMKFEKWGVISYSYHDTYSYHNKERGISILGTNLLVVNAIEFEKLSLDYSKLKNMLN